MAGPDSSPRAQTFPSRNPRRRQRKESEEGGSLRQQPQRKRSKLSKDVSTTLPDVAANDNDQNSHTNGHGQLLHPEQSQTIRVPLREKRAGPGKKVTKDDGTVILSKTANYVVKHLPTFPSAPGISSTATFRGYFAPSNGYALVLTRDQALIWDASSSNASSSTRSFSLPHPSGENETLPVGALVTNGSAREMGLVVISPSSGTITFWENIENAYALSLFSQHRNGIEMSIPGLYSSEEVVSIENAEHAGFVLVFNSGRTAQLTLRDSQSRPAIAINFLRDHGMNAGSGLFGGLRSMFSGGGWVRDVIAARPRQSQQRGHMEVLAVDKSITFQLWEISWSGQAMLKTQFHAKDEVESTLKKTHSRISENAHLDIHILDFAFSADPEYSANSVTPDGVDLAIDLVVLVAIIGSSSTEFALVELSGGTQSPMARRTVLLQSYAAPLLTKSNWRPRLYLPRPYHTAFVVFEQAVVLTSWPEPASSPEAQLNLKLKSFQDTIYFRDNDDFYIMGAGEEEESDFKRRNTSILLFVRKFGLVRITAPEPGNANGILVTAKSKIEQAIYYGTIPSNPLDLGRKFEMNFDIREVEESALEISNEVLQSASSFSPPLSHSTEHQLEQRMRTLEDLARHLKYNYRGISRLVKWKLRWNAEKMAAAHQIWLNLGSRLDENAAGERLLLPSLIRLLNERYKTPRDPNSGELDPVRHFFAKDVWRIEKIIPWAHETISDLYRVEGGNVRGKDQLLSLVSQANDLVLGGLETAFAFRIESAELYGLEDEALVDGILESGYGDLPEFWTSTHNIVDRNYRLTHLALELAWSRFEVATDEETHIERIVRKVAQENARLVKITCECYEEAQRWCLAQGDPEIKARGRRYEADLKVKRKEMLTSLPKIGQVIAGMSLAEKYHDMDALVYLVAEEADYYRDTLTERNLTEEMAQQSQERLANLEERITVYFRKFGAPWRDAFFSKQIGSEKFATLLEHSPKFKAQVTEFLRDKTSRAKLGWINDVLQEQDYKAAGRALMDGAATNEVNLWSKRVELSLAKLALVAAKENHQTSDDVLAYEEKNESDVQIIKIQEKILRHIGPALYSAVDRTAELQLAMAAFGQITTKGKPALSQLLERAFESLIGQTAMDASQLIDILTLMDPRPSEIKADDISGQEFHLALQVLKHAYMHQEDDGTFDMLLKTVWRRCMIRDDWDSLNDTSNRSDEEVEDDLTSTVLFKTFYNGEAEGMWKPGSNLQAPAPKDCLGVGTTPEEYEYRFSNAQLRVPIARDVKLEDERLASIISYTRLEYWQQSCKEYASTLYKEQTDYEAEQGAKAQKVTQEIHQEDEDLARGGRRVGGGQAADEA